MSRLVSFVVLLAIIVLVAVLFFRVMAVFVIPLFLALILVVVFRPVHDWIMAKCGGRGHLAAGLTTSAILLIVLLPILVILGQAAWEGRSFLFHLKTGEPGHDELKTLIADGVTALNLDVSEQKQQELETNIHDHVEELLKNILPGVAQGIGKGLLGFLVMVVALYFFLLDGPAMVDTLLRLWPLDARHKAELLEQFTSVSRAVVVATLLAAVAQGVLAGVGFWFAGMRPVFLLMSLTMLLAMVPFVGAISVWVPCVAWIYFYEHRLGAAIGLAAYCTIVVSQIDNVIKPMVLHGRSNLHPLLALLSVLGGVTALGPIGIMVGPMAVAFLQTLLNMLHTELVSLDHGLAHVADRPPSGRRTAPHDALRPVVRRIRMMVGKWTTARRR